MQSSRSFEQNYLFLKIYIKVTTKKSAIKCTHKKMKLTEQQHQSKKKKNYDTFY